MAYYAQLDADYWDHPKTLKMIELMGQRGETIPLKMWSWAAKFKLTGVFDSPLQLALACRFKGDPTKVQDALKTAGFLDPDGLTIHDWMERTGRGLAAVEVKKAKDHERYMAKLRGESAGNSTGNPQRTQGEFPPLSERNGTERNGTEQTPPSPRGDSVRSRKGRGRGNRPSLDDVLSQAVQEGNDRDRQEPA